MKIVTDKYGNIDDKFMVTDNDVYKGCYFQENTHVLCNNKEILIEIAKKANEEEITVYKCVKSEDVEGDIDFEYLSDELNYSKTELEKLQERYPYIYDCFQDEVLESKEFFECYLDVNDIEYLEYWDGHNWVQKDVEVITDNDEIQCIDTDIEEYTQNKVHQYDLYLVGNKLVLVYSSYYQGSLDIVEDFDISKEELLERFNYTVDEEVKKKLA